MNRASVRAVKKWGLRLTIPVVAVFGFSYAGIASWESTSGWTFSLGRGALLVMYDDLPRRQYTSRWELYPVWQTSSSVRDYTTRLLPSWSRYDNNVIFMEDVSIPLWPLVASAVGPTVWACRRESRARRREQNSACASCGYSRAGLDPAAPCPECGKGGSRATAQATASTLERPPPQSARSS